MTKSYTIARTYDRRATGFRIGIAELQVESKSDIVFMLNGQELPAKSVDHLLTFAMQTLQDAYAGADTDAAAKAAFDAKLAKIIAGTLGVRTGGGEAVSDETRHARIILRPHVAKAIGKDEWKAMDEPARLEAIDAAYAGLDTDTLAAVDAAVAEAIAAERNRAKLSIKL